ncbi:MAG: prephenate dehydrogenase [Candidatus Limnocylindrales bacterium]
MAASPRSVAILGLGLIGGSLARALARAGGWHVVAWDRSSAGPARALAEGTIQGIAPDAMSASVAAHLVVLAVPVPASLELIALIGRSVVAAGGVLTDVGSTKTPVMAAADRIADLRFVGGHPMSGREAAGYDAAQATLFDGRPWVLVPGPASRPADLALLEAMVEACGAVPVRLDAAAHDRAVAAISHLPLVVSVALASAAMRGDDWPTAQRLAAQGWRDMTRLARGAPGMGAGMLATNAPAVAERLRAYRAELEAWQERLDALAASASDSASGDGATDDAELVARLAEIARGLEGPAGEGP